MMNNIIIHSTTIIINMSHRLLFKFSNDSEESPLTNGLNHKTNRKVTLLTVEVPKMSNCPQVFFHEGIYSHWEHL